MAIQLNFNVHNTSGWNGDLALLEQNIQAAANLWGNVFTNSAHFTVTLNLVNTTNYLASSGPSDLLYAGKSAGNNLWLSSTQLSLFTNVNSNDGANNDIELNVATNYIQDGTVRLNTSPFTSGTSVLAANQLDFISIAQHELGHAFGLFGWRDVTTGTLPSDAMSLYDQHVVVRNNGIYFVGENVSHFYPNGLQLALGSLYHMGSLAQTSDPLNTDLMNPFAHWGAHDQISALDAAVMADLGYSTSFNDILHLRPGITSINAGKGDDVIYSASTNDMIDGGEGIDHVVYSGAAQSYRLSISASGISVTDVRGIDGSDLLSNVEYIDFSDMTLDTSWFAKTMQLDASHLTNLVELYIATFNRAPDAVGLNYWGGRLADGMSLEDIAKSFFDQPETQASYSPNISDQAFITKLYQNTLGRAPDSEGLAYWTKELQSHHIDRGHFVLALINGAHASSGNSADAQYLLNKETVGAHFALENGLNDLPSAKSVLSGIGLNEASVHSGLALADNYLSLASQPASSQLVVQLIGLPA